MTRSAPPAASVANAGAEWVVCLGELREVRRGMVMCPKAGARVPLETCLECHHLSDVWDERDRDAPCAVGPGIS